MNKNLRQSLKNGMMIEEYNQFIQTNGHHFVSQLFRAGEKGVIFSVGKEKKMEHLQEQREHAEVDGDVRMHAVQVKNTFDADFDSLEFVIAHHLCKVSNNRPSSTCTGLNFWFGKTTNPCVRATPTAAKEDRNEYMRWNQSFQHLFAPLYSQFMMELTVQATKYTMAFNQVWELLQTKERQLDVWRICALTILTRNFSNMPHQDVNDCHDSTFLKQKQKQVQAIKIRAKRALKKRDKMHKKLSREIDNEIELKKLETEKKQLLQTVKFLERKVSSKKQCSTSTTCGYKFNMKLLEDEELFATFTNVSMSKSVLLEDNLYLFFYGAISQHNTTAPMVVNWAKNTVRLLDEDSILAWGAGKRGAARTHLENNGYQIQGRRITSEDIRNYLTNMVQQGNQAAVNAVRTSNWYNADRHSVDGM